MKHAPIFKKIDNLIYKINKKIQDTVNKQKIIVNNKEEIKQCNILV